MDRQESEITALSSIYDCSVFTGERQKDSGLYSGNFSCHYKLDVPITLISASDATLCRSSTVNYLGPLLLYFTLPVGYPEHDMPNFTISCTWLTPSQLRMLRDRLFQIRDENLHSEILFLWFGFLSEALSDLINGTEIDLVSVAKESEAFIHSESQKFLHNSLDIVVMSPFERLRLCEAFDIEQENRDLESTHFQCQICFGDKLGKNAAVFKPCRHMFCKVCLNNYFTDKIEDGSVENILCPENCESVASLSLIRSIVNNNIFQRYDALLLTKSLNSIGDMAYCPRLSCHYPVLYDKDSQTATCPSCSHSFCVFCRQSSHGVAPCRFGLEEIEIIRAKLLSGNVEEKKFVEERYGKEAIKQALEEYESNLFLHGNCKKCPSCQAWCEKVEGCNKMTCLKCRGYFCWICNSILNRNDPYSHYSVSELGGCAGLLFEGVEDGNEDGEDFDGGEPLVDYVDFA